MPTAPPGDDVAFRAGHRSSAKDVARLAGVSTATVSRVINSAEQVDSETRARVRDAMAKRVSPARRGARLAQRQEAAWIGAIVPSFGYALYARTTQRAPGGARRGRLLAGAGRAPLRPRQRAAHHRAASGPRRRRLRLRGCITIRGCSHLLEHHGRPYVRLGRRSDAPASSIGFDNRAATFAMTRLSDRPSVIGTSGS